MNNKAYSLLLGAYIVECCLNMVESMESPLVSQIDPYPGMRDNLVRTWHTVKRKTAQTVGRIYLSAVLVQGPVLPTDVVNPHGKAGQCDMVCEALKLSNRISDMRTVNTPYFQGIVFDNDKCGVGLARINRKWETFNKCPKGGPGHRPFRPWNQ